MSWSDFLFIPDAAMTSQEQADNYARLQNALAAQDAARQQAGTITAAQLAANNKLLSTPLSNQDAAAWDGFISGLGEGSQNVSNGIWSGLKTALGLVPSPVWVALAVGGFLYLGGGVWLMKHSKGVLAKV